MERNSVKNVLVNNWQEVGKWFNELELDVEDVVWTEQEGQVPRSVCSEECKVGEVRRAGKVFTKF